MNQKNLIILFYLNRAKTNQQGICPIYCRLTYLHKRKQFSTGQFVNPVDWISKKQQAIKGCIGNQQINLQLELISNEIRKAYLQLQLSGGEFTVEDIFTSYLGKPIIKDYGLVRYFKEYLNKKEKLIGKDIQYVTWKKSNYVYLQLVEFIKWKFDKNDILETPDIVYHPRRVKVTIAGRTKVTHPRRAKVTHL